MDKNKLLQLTSQALWRNLILLNTAIFWLPQNSFSQLPDLRPEISSITLDRHQTIDPADVAEGCASATTDRLLLRFTLATRNDRPGPLNLGDPLCPDCFANPGLTCGNSLFECSAASGHGHPHVHNFSTYSLLDSNGALLYRGHKEGFCLADSQCEDTPPQISHPECSYLSAGCADIYSSGIGCQYIDVTGLKSGTYRLRVQLNEEGLFPELSMLNNTKEIPIKVCGVSRHLSFELSEPKLKLRGDRTFSLEGITRLQSKIEVFDPLKNGMPLRVTFGGLPFIDLFIPAGGPRTSCGPKDGWHLEEDQSWSYQSQFGFIDQQCFNDSQGLRSIQIRRSGQDISFKITGRLPISFGTTKPNFIDLQVPLNTSQDPLPVNCYLTTTTKCRLVGVGRKRMKCQ